jgi:hypothetical protein
VERVATSMASWSIWRVRPSTSYLPRRAVRVPSGAVVLSVTVPPKSLVV